jgi:hypothetical protein
MTTETPGSPPTDDRARTSALGLSPAQVAGSALAAVTGAFLAARLGVAGTLAGVAIGSVVGTLRSASYTYWLRHSHALVRGRTARPIPHERWWLALPWSRLAAGVAVVGALGLGTLTLVEGLAGQPVSSLATGGQGGGTTLGQSVGQVVGHATSGGTTNPGSPTPSPSQDPSGAPSSPATPTPSPSPSGTPSPDPTPTPDPTQPPSPSPTGPPAPVSP